MDPVSNACDDLFDLCQGRVLVGFSGGMDSTVLFHALAVAAADRGISNRLLGIHVDHGLDPRSGDWAVFCADLAARLGVDLRSEVVTVDAGSNLEARARHARYQMFERHLQEGDLLVLAHHAGDQIESQFLHLLQGRGLYGMPAARALGRGRLIRPLLELPRTELAAYAREKALRWIEDPGNSDLDIDRNYLRASVLPELVERFPELPRRLDQLARSSAATSAALVEVAELEQHPLPLSLLDGRSQPTRLSLLRQWLIAHDAASGVTGAALLEFLRQLDSANDRQPSLMTSSGRLLRHRRRLYLVTDPPVLAAEYQLEVPGELQLPHGMLRACRSTPVHSEPDFKEPVLDEDGVCLVPPVRICFAPGLAPDCRFQVRGRLRGLRELMREAGVPPWARDSLPLVADSLGLAVVPGVAVRDPEAGSDTAGVEDGSKNSGAIGLNIRWVPDVR